MTKEELYAELANVETEYGINPVDVCDLLNMFFASNVVIPKGQQRHPDAIPLCEWLLDFSKEVEANFRNEGYWKDMSRVNALIISDAVNYRIKPSEPVWEYRVRMNFKDGAYEYTHKYFTKQEFEDFGFPSSCELAEETKQERKQ